VSVSLIMLWQPLAIKQPFALAFLALLPRWSGVVRVGKRTGTVGAYAETSVALVFRPRVPGPLIGTLRIAFDSADLAPCDIVVRVCSAKGQYYPVFAEQRRQVALWHDPKCLCRHTIALPLCAPPYRSATLLRRGSLWMYPSICPSRWLTSDAASWTVSADASSCCATAARRPCCVCL